MADIAEGSKQQDWAFALVHGIGTADRLHMIQEVAGALRQARPGLELAVDAEVHEIIEPDPDNTGKDRVRHIVVRHGDIPGGGKVRLATAHWADITYYRQGFLALIGTILMTAFGVRHFAEVAARSAKDSGPVERTLSAVLRFLLRNFVRLLAVVVFPITFVALVFSLTGLVAEYAIRDQISLGENIKFADLQRVFIMAVAGGGCLLCAGIGWRRIEPMREERTLGRPMFLAIGAIAFAVALLMPFHNTRVDWVVFFGREGQTCGLLRDCLREYLMLLAAINNPYLAERINLVDGIGVVFALFHVSQVATGLFLLGLTSVILIVLTAYWLVARLAGHSPHTAIFAVVSTMTIWLVLLIVLWPENLMTYSAMGRYTRPEAPTQVTALFLEWEKEPRYLYQANVPVAAPDAKTRGLRDYYPIQWFELMYFGFLCLASILFGLVFAARWLIRAWRRRSPLSAFRIPQGEKRPRRDNWPRLIIAQIYVALVLLLMLLTSFTSVTHLFQLEPRVLDTIGIGTPSRAPPPEVFFQAEFIRLLVIFFAGALLLFSHRILDGIRLVLDVVNHFAQPDRYPVRSRIENRFYETIDRLVPHCPPHASSAKPNLVIMAHSQGTVITLDALRNATWIKDLLGRVSTLTVITFGSPITHVYQRYFPQDYPDLAHTGLQELAKDPRIRWVNAYRIDDYVGTYIENSIEGFPANVPLPIGGHTAYWQRDAICRVLADPKLAQFVLPALYHEPVGAIDKIEPDYFQ